MLQSGFFSITELQRSPPLHNSGPKDCSQSFTGLYSAPCLDVPQQGVARPYASRCQLTILTMENCRAVRGAWAEAEVLQSGSKVGNCLWVLNPALHDGA